MPSPLQELRELTTPGAVFTVAWPQPFVIRGNTGTAVLNTPPDLRTVERVTANTIYYKKGDGSPTRGDFPKAALVEKRGDGCYVLYDPVYTEGMSEEVPGRRGKVNRVLWIGDRKAAIASRLEATGNRLATGDWNLDLIASRTPGGEVSLTTLFVAGSADRVRLGIGATGNPSSAFIVGHIEGVDFETPITGEQVRQVLLSARYKSPDEQFPIPVIRYLPVAWQHHAVRATEEMVPERNQKQMLKVHLLDRLAAIEGAGSFVVFVAVEQGSSLVLRAHDGASGRTENYEMKLNAEGKYAGGQYRVDVAPLIESDAFAPLDEWQAGLVLRAARFEGGAAVVDTLQNPHLRRLSKDEATVEELPSDAPKSSRIRHI